MKIVMSVKIQMSKKMFEPEAPRKRKGIKREKRRSPK